MKQKALTIIFLIFITNTSSATIICGQMGTYLCYYLKGNHEIFNLLSSNPIMQDKLGALTGSDLCLEGEKTDEVDNGFVVSSIVKDEP